MSNSIHIIGSKMSGGAERFYARLINSLAERTTVQAINPPGSPVSELIEPGLRQFHPRMKNNYDLSSMLEIRKRAREAAPGIVQSYMGRATRLTRIPRGKGLVHVARLGGYYNLKAYRHAHHLIGNTQGICDYLRQQGVPADQVHHISNFVEPIPAPAPDELNELRESLGIPPDAFVITCAARFHENKGLPDLLDAFARLLTKTPEARLILVGDGPLAGAIHKQIETLNLKDRVLLPGWCDPRPYYHLADVLTSPSRHEPLGNTILEAWACGKPLVATQTQGATELMTHEMDGWITPLQDSESLMRAFEQLMNNPAQCAALAEAGTKTVQERYSKQFITQEYISLYEQLLAAQ